MGVATMEPTVVIFFQGYRLFEDTFTQRQGIRSKFHNEGLLKNWPTGSSIIWDFISIFLKITDTGNRLQLLAGHDSFSVMTTDIA